MEKNIFLKAFTISSIIFIMGIFVGIWIDNLKTEETRNELTVIETRWNDVNLKSSLFDVIETDEKFCNESIKSNFKFFEDILEEGYLIEKREEVNKFDSSLIIQKKRYALLMLQYWYNAVELKKKCSADYDTIIYFYSNFDNELKNKQEVQSNILIDLLDSCKEKLVVIPVPMDMKIDSASLLIDTFSIKKAPSLLVNEKTVLEDVTTKETLSKYINCPVP